MTLFSTPRRGLVLLLVLALVLGGGWWLFSRQTASGTKQDKMVDKVMDLAKESGVTSFDGSKVDAKGNPLEGAVGLALQGINLFQGEKGLELWRLKATWAHLSKDGDEINVDKPHVVYAMGDTGLPPRSSSATDSAAEEAEPLAGPNKNGQADKNEQADKNGQANQPDKTEQADTSADFSNFGDADVLDVTAQKGRVTDHQRYLTLWDDVLITRFGDILTGPRMNYDSTTRTMTFPEGAKLESVRGSGTATILHWDLANNVITAEKGVTVLLKPRPREEEEKPDSTAPTEGKADKTLPVQTGVETGTQTGPQTGVQAGTQIPAQIMALTPVQTAAQIPALAPGAVPPQAKAAVTAPAPKKDAQAAQSSQSKKAKKEQKKQKKSQAASSRKANSTKRDTPSTRSGTQSGTKSGTRSGSQPTGKP